MIKLVKNQKIEILNGYTIIEATGNFHVNRIKIARFDKNYNISSNPEYVDCDLVLTSGGLNPTVHLHSQARGKVE